MSSASFLASSTFFLPSLGGFGRADWGVPPALGRGGSFGESLSAAPFALSAAPPSEDCEQLIMVIF